jgi:hypothetical protein
MLTNSTSRRRVCRCPQRTLRESRATGSPCPLRWVRLCMSRIASLREETTCRKSSAAFIGIDWADRKHDVCLAVPGFTKLERLVLEHRPAAIRAWAEKLRERFGGAKVAVCLELARGPIVSALLEHDFFVLFPVQPATLARYRSAFTTSRAKDDPTDAALALELLLRHPDKLTRLEPESVGMRSLRRLVEARRTLVGTAFESLTASSRRSRRTFCGFRPSWTAVSAHRDHSFRGIVIGAKRRRRSAGQWVGSVSGRRRECPFSSSL